MRLFGWLALALAGALTWLVGNGEVAASRPPDLGLLPERLGALVLGEDVSFDASLLGEAPPDRWTYRRVDSAAAGEPGRLYLAYFLRGKRWSGRPHPVEVCYDALGWEELEARLVETERGSVFWSRRFAREDREVRVFHWLQRPGRRPRMGLWNGLLERLGGAAGLRQDVASVYWEFPAATAPGDELLGAAADALVDELENAWR